LNSAMIAGSAMLSCPLSAVTSRVAMDATDSDSQRRLRDDRDSSCDKVMGGGGLVQGSTFKVQGLP
jgi:hypothetical protein